MEHKKDDYINTGGKGWQILKKLLSANLLWWDTNELVPLSNKLTIEEREEIKEYLEKTKENIENITNKCKELKMNNSPYLKDATLKLKTLKMTKLNMQLVLKDNAYVVNSSIWSRKTVSREKMLESFRLASTICVDDID